MSNNDRTAGYVILRSAHQQEESTKVYKTMSSVLGAYQHRGGCVFNTEALAWSRARGYYQPASCGGRPLDPDALQAALVTEGVSPDAAYYRVCQALEQR